MHILHIPKNLFPWGYPCKILYAVFISPTCTISCYIHLVRFIQIRKLYHSYVYMLKSWNVSYLVELPVDSGPWSDCALWINWICQERYQSFLLECMFTKKNSLYAFKVSSTYISIFIVIIQCISLTVTWYRAPVCKWSVWTQCYNHVTCQSFC